MPRLPYLATFCLLFLMCCGALSAEQGKLSVYVTDTEERPIPKIQISLAGPGGGPQRTDPTGRAQLLLAPQTKPNSWIILQIVKSPPSHDFVIVSPWDSRALIPSFANDSVNTVSIVVVERGAKEALRSGLLMRSVVQQFNRREDPSSVSTSSSSTDSKIHAKDSLAEVAKQYGFAPEDLDKAIRTWAFQSKTDFDQGVAALYLKHFPEATKALLKSKAELAAKRDLLRRESSDNAFYLGQSYYAQGMLQLAINSFEEAITFTPEDTYSLNSLTNCYLRLHDVTRAELRVNQALEILQRQESPDKNQLAISKSNKAAVLHIENKDEQALQLYMEALSLSDSPEVTATINNGLGILYKGQERYTEAERYHKDALAVRSRLFGSESPEAALSLNNLGTVRFDMKDYQGAEAYERHALAIYTKSLGSNDILTISQERNLAQVLEQERKFKEAIEVAEDEIAALTTTGDVTDLEVFIVKLRLMKLLFEDLQPKAGNNMAIELDTQCRTSFHTEEDRFNCLSNLGITFGSLANLIRAEDYFRSAITLCEIHYCRVEITADVYRQSGDMYREHHQKAAAVTSYETALHMLGQTPTDYQIFKNYLTENIIRLKGKP